MAKKKTDTDKPSAPAKEEINDKNVPVAEALIATALRLGQAQELTLGELIGHMECAKLEVYEKITTTSRQAAMEQAKVAAAQAEDADKPELKVLNPS